MVAIIRFVGPQGKSFITRATTWRTEAYQASGVIWDRALRKYGQSNFRREVLWQDKNAAIDAPLVTRKFNSFVREYDPEFNL
tara:strand:- start:816 stop:1061 length:246 start_codon:yes stop_codon:yes gene_type:complete